MPIKKKICSYTCFSLLFFEINGITAKQVQKEYSK